MLKSWKKEIHMRLVLVDMISVALLYIHSI